MRFIPARFRIIVSGRANHRNDRDVSRASSIIDSSLTSDADVNMRIKSATSAFGALKNSLTSLPVDLRVKGRIYSALFLSILLYGSEAGCGPMMAHSVTHKVVNSSAD